MVLADLLFRLGYNFVLAHVNYGLRAEAIKETALVYQWAMERQLSLFVKFASAHRLNDLSDRGLQNAARQYRYDFFREILESYNAAGVVTAHHQDDQIETFILKAIQGGGLLSVSGMESFQNSFYKPLLGVTRQDITSYARDNLVPFLDDSSNANGTYMRNRIRNEVLPLLRDIHPGAVEGINRTLDNLGEHRRDTVSRLKSYEETRLTKWRDLEILPWPVQGEGILCKIYLLSMGFNNEQIEDILGSMNASGRIFHTRSLSLTTFHSGLVLLKSRTGTEMTFYRRAELPSAFETDETLDIKTSDQWEGIFAPHQLAYPLFLRPWQEGDVIQPLGMEGRTKKVQDILTDRKIPSLLKKRVMILEDVRGKILWIPGIVRSTHALIGGKDPGLKLRLRSEHTPFPEDLF
jgi:tRNA(Ile)-lysidine synthase